MTQRPTDSIVFDLMATPEGRADPYPLYEELRAGGRVLRSEELPVWYLTGFDDSRAVLRDSRCGKHDGIGRSIVAGEEVASGVDDREAPSMLFLNPPDHTRLRGLVSRAFTPRRIEELHSQIEAMVDELLDEIAEHGEVDFIDALAYRLPVRVISEMVGLPYADRDRFRALTAVLVKTLEPIVSDADAAAAGEAFEQFHEYFVELIDERRSAPADDLVTGLLQARDGDDALTEDEMISTLVLLYAAGFETTTNLIGNGMYCLLRAPDQMAALRSDPSLLSTAIDEMLRFESPVQLDGRYVFEAVELAGVTLPAGHSAITLLGAANRDPSHVERPEIFDISRTNNQILSFASGIHYCLGASLARLEGKVVFERLLDRFATIDLAEEPAWKQNLTLRGLESLRVGVS